jgi:hypothetical protein
MKSNVFLMVYQYIVVECKNGCTDAPSTFEWIKRYRPDLVDDLGAPPGLEGRDLRAFLQTINFHAVRENCVILTDAVEF